MPDLQKSPAKGRAVFRKGIVIFFIVEVLGLYLQSKLLLQLQLEQ
jgi:hypothetical protein